jgi:translation initiation factor IF-2
LPKKIRVYELARELGLTNKEALDLCVALGIGVKSHSSSIEDAQADRVRRKADSEGLRRAVSPEEPTEQKQTRATTSRAGRVSDDTVAAASTESAPSNGSGSSTPASSRPVPAGSTPPAPIPPAPAPDRQRLVTSRPASEIAVPPPAPRPTPAPAARPAPAPPARPAAAPPARPAPPAVAASAPAAAPDLGAPPSRPAPGSPPPPRVRPPMSSSGRPIPPPPGPPRTNGRPIPPPPGRRAPTGAPRPGGGPGAGARPGMGGSRPGGGPPGRGGPGGGGGFGGRPGGGGGFGGRPGGGGPPPPGLRGGPGGRGRPPQRRPRRRRRNLEELEPTQLTTYTPSNAPVPDFEVIVERGSTPRELGPKLNRSAGDVIRFLFLQGEVVTAAQSLSDDMIELFAAEIGAQIRLVDRGEEQEAELQAKYFEEEEEEREEDLRPRPPVVTVMGHVDHGKTLLLDRIRHANVVAGESGGITQHIGAYQAEIEGNRITFIDTPGHQAFTAMRARGAEVTDIVVLVVAADDGVMPQTIEAIDHARAADVPIVVALNKIDRPDADVTRVLQQLSQQDLTPEAWGGNTIVVEISALTGEGIDNLLEQLAVVAELEELQASPEARARGVVLEANLESGRGPVATVIVQSGTLRVGDSVVAGAAWGKVKALIDDHGEQVKEAPPSTPVQVLGFSEPPGAGDEFRVTSDQTTARTIGETREHRYRVAGHAPSPTAPGAKLEDLFEQIQRGEAATLNLILKSDVQGTLEAITDSLRKLERPDVKLSFVHRGVGGITEYDVQLAVASNATIIGFNVRPDRRAREMAVERGVGIRTYEVIYKLLEDIEAAMVGMLAPEFEEVVTGEAEVREVFRVPRIGAVAGCYVRDGVITRGSKVRFLREGVIIWKGTINSLRRFKDDVREVQAGFECGIGLSDFQDLHNGDIIETFEEREIPRT